jgi:two-component system sensor histidine kinase CpxA
VKSISGKILIGAITALVISLAAFLLMANEVTSRTIRSILTHFSEWELHEAIQAYERGGSGSLESYIADLQHFVPATYLLTDAAGRDLLTGADNSAFIQEMGTRAYWNSIAEGQVRIAVASDDLRYRWFIVVARPFSPTTFLPFYALLAALFAGLYWFVYAQVTRPLANLTSVVDLFGRGDLTPRADASRKDEIGRLADAFNQLASRINTLLSAERQLLLDVSHELRSPLARLTFAAEMVRKTDDRDAAVLRLRHEIDRLSELVSTLIDVTRAEGDPNAFQVEAVDFKSLVEFVANDCSIEAADRQCSIKAEEVSGAIWVRGNRELLRRAIENVIRNAIRYSPQLSSVNIKVFSKDGHGIMVVRDFGPGIPSESLDKIFRPFFRVDPSREASAGGIGMGLTIAQRAVLAHRGVIAAENALPGLRVCISLPIMPH